MPTRPILVFDVKETLLDLETVRPVFARIFGDGAVLREWFAQLILYSNALTLAGTYADFAAIGGAVLQMLGAIHGIPIAEDDRQAVREAVATMPPHPDVPDALRRLRAGGFRMVTLTNNPAATCQRQLDAAGVLPLFERLFSVDDGSRRYKPAPETYAAVREALGAEYGDLLMVACHTWDTLGAAATGMRSALLLRPGNAPLAVGPQPDFVCRDLAELADRLIETFPD